MHRIPTYFIDTHPQYFVYQRSLHHLTCLLLKLLKISNRSSMPWNYETYRPRTGRYGAAYYGMLAELPRDRQWRYEPPTNSRDSRRSEFDTAPRGMRRSEKSQRSQQHSCRAASQVSTNNRHHQPPPPVEERMVPYALQSPSYGLQPPSRRPEPAYQAESAPRRSSRCPISSGYYTEPSNLSVPSSMHGQVSSSRNSSVRSARAHVDPVPHDRFRRSPMFYTSHENSHKSRDGQRNELRRAARDFDRREHGQRGRDYEEPPGRWYDRGLSGRSRRGERR